MKFNKISVLKYTFLQFESYSDGWSLLHPLEVVYELFHRFLGYFIVTSTIHVMKFTILGILNKEIPAFIHIVCVNEIFLMRWSILHSLKQADNLLQFDIIIHPAVFCTNASRTS